LIGVDIAKVKMVGVAALVILLGLLGAVDWLKGWFPLWPRFTHLPGLLFSMETSLAAIPSYWLDEIIAGRMETSLAAIPIYWLDEIIAGRT
jgi:hypothetical protein